MPSNNQKKHFIITTIDFCTHWPLVQAITSYDDKFIYRFISQEIKEKFGYIQYILSNYGREFVSKDTQAYLNNKNIKHITSIPYHAQVNDYVEYFNSILLDALCKLSSKNPST